MIGLFSVMNMDIPSIPNIDISSIMNMIGPLIGNLLKSIAGMANQLGSAIYPQNPTLALLAIAVVAAFLLKDKLSGGIMFIIIAMLLWLIMSGKVIV